MSSLEIPAWLGGGAAAVGAGLSTGELAGAALGAGALEGTTAAGLSEIGSILPEGALAAGSLTGGADLAAGLFSGGGAGGIETTAVPTLGGGVGAGGGVPAAAIASPAAPAANAPAGSFAGGVIGGAASSAAPVSAPVSPTTSGLFGAPIPDTSSPLVVGANAPQQGQAIGNLSGFAGPNLDGQTVPLGGAGGIVGTPAAPAGPWPGGGAPAPNSVDAFLSDPSLGSAWGVVKANPNLTLATLGLGANMLLGNKGVSGEGQLRASADRLSEQGATLQNYLTSGTLPPGVQSGLTGAGAAAKATIRSRHAASGTSGSSAEASELSAVDTQMTTRGVDIALQLFQSGLSEAQLSSQLYTTILQGALSEDQELGQAIGRFASAAVGAPVIQLGRGA